ncbi:hypothetical protein QYF61_025651 [Mycteria americana]|uniref:Uncharacterized protein n=1 Tax=Mycteria americana TaxID=33587 RepID=A0AAN7NST3_MYCAM|nr:hypothetical protein QYF61_025651 [Mycteria americana]
MAFGRASSSLPVPMRWLSRGQTQAFHSGAQQEDKRQLTQTETQEPCYPNGRKENAVRTRRRDIRRLSPWDRERPIRRKIEIILQKDVRCKPKQHTTLATSH